MKIIAIITLLTMLAAAANGQSKGGYAMVSFAACSPHGTGFGGSINAGYKGGNGPSIGIGMDILHLQDYPKIYLPVYLDIRPFYKQFFATFQVGYANNTSQVADYSGGIYAGLGIGGVFSQKKTSPFVSVKAVRHPLSIKENDLSMFGGQLNFGVKF